MCNWITYDVSYTSLPKQQEIQIAMGTPLAPTLANLFLGHYKGIWLNEYEGDIPLFYRRYVDDIFAVFENRDQALGFVEYINSKHVNIKFTIEENNKGILHFLDVVVNNNDVLTTCVYHKPTFTGLLINFRSFVPSDNKIKLIQTLIDRIFKINNTWKRFDCDVKTLCHYLPCNLFPGRFIDRHIKQYLDSKMSVKKDSKEKPSEIRYIKLPYIGEFSGIAKNKIMKLFKQFCKSD